MDFLPDYIRNNAEIVDKKKDKTKCYLKCNCGGTSFYVFYLHFKWDKEAQNRFDNTHKEFDIEVKKREDKCNAFRKENEKKYGKLISSSGFYKGKQYFVLAKRWMRAQEVGTGDFLKSDGCVAFLDITHEYDILTSIHSKLNTGYSYLTAECRCCKKEILLFDSRIHGYDGLCKVLEGEKQNNDTTGIIKQKRPHCKEEGYRVFLTFSSTGKEDLITETDGLISEDNWKDAFDCLIIDLKCDKCGKMTKRWQDIETM